MKHTDMNRETPLVLIVDDDETMRLLASETLVESGFTVEEATDGLAGVESFERLKPDIVLLDVQMPGLDGFTVCSRLRCMPGGEFVPVLMMTGLNDTESINRAYQSGATDFVTKPLNWAHLGHHLRYVLRSSRTAEELRKSEEELRISKERYALAARGANDGLWDWNIEAGTIYYSPRWKSMLGLSEDEVGLTLDEWFSRIHPSDVEHAKVLLSAHLDGVSHLFEAEYRMLHKDTIDRWVLCRAIAVRDENGKAYRMAGSMTDITIRKRAEQQLLRDAFYDSLTGLPNRALLMDRLEHTWKRAVRNNSHVFAVMFLDLDRFKVINDSLGHNIGDELLVKVSGRLRDCVRTADTVARLGGDEFVILLEDSKEAEDVRYTAERILEVLREPFVIDGTEMFITCSIGIVLSSTEDYLKSEDLLRDADTAMYQAKAKGKARYEFFDRSMHAHAVTALQLGSELRKGLEKKEFRLHYQPIISLLTGQTISVEALIRWEHPRRGLVMPDEFIPHAEESGLIAPIGEWVLRTACSQIKAWNDSGMPRLTVAVNLSPRQLKQKNFVEMVKEILDETGLDAELLDLEITERVIMEDSQEIMDMLRRLRELGVHLSIDDFGTGYSSLSYLPRLPVNSVKIDRSFISRMTNDPQNFEIIRSVVSLSSLLGLESTAEGVETVDQLEKLKEIGCSQSQGYLFCKPGSNKEIESILKSTGMASPAVANEGPPAKASVK